jgi:pimeloyl-ACP methyl ester carboxylesterase
MALLALLASLVFVWFQGGLDAAETHQTKRPAKLARFGVKSLGEKDWEALPDRLPERLVLLVHGLDEPGDLWRDLAPALRQADVPTARFDYPNDQVIAISSTLLGTWLPKLRQRGTKQVAIVAHSMGGLVVREYLTNPADDYRKKLLKGDVPRIRALVMVGTPNHGSPMARFRLVAEVREQWSRLLRGDGELLGALEDGDGEAGTDLLPNSAFLQELNARPLPRDVRFTIIAGIVSPLARKDLEASAKRWQHGLPGFMHGAVDKVEEQLADVADGMGDGVVSLASTRLQGVDDQVAVRGNHISMVRGTGKAGRESPPSVPIILERVRRTWPGRFAKLDLANQEDKP